MNSITIKESHLEDVKRVVVKHMETLSYPMDSWLEDMLMKSDLYCLQWEDSSIGYAGVIEGTLHFFYIQKEHLSWAPLLLERIIEERSIKRLFVMTQDSLLSALIAEWDYEKEKQACWFSDCKKIEMTDTPIPLGVFRPAINRDVVRIREIAGDFFDEVSGGYHSLEERIEGGTIFVLEKKEILLGCGIVEMSQFISNLVSIGMYTSKEYRRMGVAKTVLLKLKEWAYTNRLTPVAGCWYYNTLSRRSLESAGMFVTSIGYEAILKGKEKLPLRSGNPPGELVE